MTEVQQTRGKVLHWAEKATTERNQEKEKGIQSILPGKKGERHKSQDYQKKKIEHLP